jgi:heterodisulfide reductase subunit A
MRETMERIGVFICECGPNIKEAIDLAQVVTFARELNGVVLAKPVKLLCSAEGKQLLADDIREHELTRVVIAACSPKEHELTFRQVLGQAGLNPYLLHIANIREQCAWVIKDKPLATRKAMVTIAGAVQRVGLHEPLDTRQIDCQADVLVVGAGIAGISAALALAQKKRKVYLIERSPCIGGKVARYEEVFPNLECASCMLDPKLDEVLHNDRIELLTFSEVREILGSYGNFIVRITQKARGVDASACIGCGACFEACPVKVANEYNEGLDERRAIYTPYAGSLPNVAVVDDEHCLRFQGQECDACQKACPFGAVNLEEPDRDLNINVGAVILATGFDLFDLEKAPRYGYGQIENVYTALEFERMLSSTGPTGGRIVRKNGQPPEKIALVHCAGSRTENHRQHCSGVCCLYSLKFAHLASQKLSHVNIVELFSDLCLPGKEGQRFYHQVGREKTQLLRIKAPDSIEVRAEGDEITIHYDDVSGAPQEVSVDMVVLAPAMEGSRDHAGLSAAADVSVDGDGFFTEEHTKLAPVSTTREGIFIAGCAQGPKDIQSSVAQGQAAAGVILSRLIPGEKLTLETMTSVVDEERCSGCKTCLNLCSYKAITYDEEERHVTVNEALCRGCGVCAAACPSGNITARHFTDEQIYMELAGLLR